MAIEPRKPPSRFIPKLQRTLGGRAGWSGFVLQLLFVAALAWISYEIVANARANLQAQRITAGFGFLANNAGFDVSQSLIPYSGSDPYTRVFFVGLLNTLLVSVIGIFFATLIGFLVVLGLPLLATLIFGAPVKFEVPALKGFNFAGGSRVIPEFVALTLALSTYTASFIAEIVRAGILSVHKGQMEAGSSLGLQRGSVLRLIVIPQAMRVILPPLTNQYLNLTKNSSLAVAIGYPDLVSVFAGTTLSQTGQAIEIIGITMGVYLLISLVTSAIMSFYGWRLGRSLEG